jgi:hypothetical protein
MFFFFSNHQGAVFFSYSFHFRHLSFNGIMKEAISSHYMSNPIYVGYYLEVYRCILHCKSPLVHKGSVEILK